MYYYFTNANEKVHGFYQENDIPRIIKSGRQYGIELIYLPPYSPDLNPEFIWKSIKRVISSEFIVDLDHMRSIISNNFQKYSSQISFAKRWIEKFIEEDYKLEMLGS
jgi:putative transposase